MATHLFGFFQSMLVPLRTASESAWQPSTDIYRTAKGWLIKFGQSSFSRYQFR